MTGTGTALLEVYAGFGEPWWVRPLAIAAESCRGIGLGKVSQRTREAVSPVVTTGDEWEEWVELRWTLGGHLLDQGLF